MLTPPSGYYTATLVSTKVIIGQTLTLPDGKVKGNIDAEMVLHAMIELKNFDRALIVTGDGDFYCLVDYLRKQRKLLKLMVPNKWKYSSLFSKQMEYIVFMNDLKGKIEYKKRR